VVRAFLRANGALEVDLLATFGEGVIIVKGEDRSIGGVHGLDLGFAILGRHVGLVDSRAEGSGHSAQLDKVVSVRFRVIALGFASVIA